MQLDCDCTLSRCGCGHWPILVLSLHRSSALLSDRLLNDYWQPAAWMDPDFGSVSAAPVEGLYGPLRCKLARFMSPNIWYWDKAGAIVDQEVGDNAANVNNEEFALTTNTSSILTFWSSSALLPGRLRMRCWYVLMCKVKRKTIPTIHQLEGHSVKCVSYNKHSNWACYKQQFMLQAKGISCFTNGREWPIIWTAFECKCVDVN